MLTGRVQNIIYKMHLSRKSNCLLIKSPISKQQLVEKMTNCKNRPITFHCIEIGTHFDCNLYVNSHPCMCMHISIKITGVRSYK